MLCLRIRVLWPMVAWSSAGPRRLQKVVRIVLRWHHVRSVALSEREMQVSSTSSLAAVSFCGPVRQLPHSPCRFAGDVSSAFCNADSNLVFPVNR